MLHAHAAVAAPAIGQRAFADSVVLTFEDRRRRRGTITTLAGLEVLVDLAEAPALAHGDAYELEDGRLIEIVAEAEELLEVRGRDPLHMLRLAWHLGNRHLETEIGPKWLRLRRDHVIADMLRGLGAKVVEIEGPFQPEGGAYDHGHAHHDHDHGHARHDDVHDHGHHDHGHHDHGHHDHHDHERHGHGDHEHAHNAHGHHDHGHHDDGHHNHGHHDHGHGRNDHAHGHHDHDKHDHDKHDHDKHDHDKHDHDKHGHDKHAHDKHAHDRHDHGKAPEPDPRKTGPEDVRRDRMNDAPQYR